MRYLLLSVLLLACVGAKNDKADIIVTIAHYLSAIITGMNQVDIASDLLINLQGLNEDQFYHIEELLGEVYGEEI